jgi:hypothetical protein
MPRLPRHCIFVCALIALSAAPLDAQGLQSAAALPFHKGQWGAEFGIGSYFPSLGFLKFRSERSAWMGDVGINVSAAAGRFEPDSGDAQDTESLDFGTTIRAGIRRYRPLGERVAAFTTFGATVGGNTYRREQEGALPYRSQQTTWRGGAFGEIGGAWLVTRNLTLGATYGGSATYTYSRSEYPRYGRTSEHGVNLGAGSARLNVTLFF